MTISTQPRTIVSVTVRALHHCAVTDMHAFAQIMGDPDLKTSLELAEHATDLLNDNRTAVHHPEGCPISGTSQCMSSLGKVLRVASN